MKTRPHQLEYGISDSTRRAVDVGLAVRIVVALTGPVVLWLLFELQRAPYRPPFDMSYLLDSNSRQLVWMWMVCIGAAWFIAAVSLLHGARKRRISRRNERPCVEPPEAKA